MKNKRIHPSVVGSGMVRPGRIRLALGGLLLLGLAGNVSPAWAQTLPSSTGAQQLPDKTYMTKSDLLLPILVDERARPGLREILLYVKEGPNGSWMLKQNARPSETGFKCHLQQDGEYWFNVVTIDKSNKAMPADVAAVPPAVIVVLDTCGPQIELKPMPDCPACADGTCVKVDVHDANPNPFQTKFEYQTGDKVWRSLEPMAGQLGCFCVPRQAVLTGMVKVSCADRAMNSSVREFNLASLAAHTTPVDVAATQSKQVTPVALFEQAKPNVVPACVPPQTKECASETGPVCQTRPSKPQALDLQCSEKTDLTTGSCPPVLQSNCEMAKECRHSDAKWMMVNQPRVSLEYKIEDEGKSGIGKVEVWITKDNGQTWDILCDDPDKKSPVACELPGEGVFGMCLVVTNGRGFGGNPPKSGDSPEYIVEVDMTKPQAELTCVKLGRAEDSANIEIVWQASDKNLGTGPVDLYYSVNQQGPWTPIAKGLANNGTYRWYLPQEICRQAYVRLVVTDMAGNSTKCESSEAVTLDDNSRPRATINAIVPVSSGVVPPQGN